MARFETHAHSMYSNIRLLDSINRPKDIILTAAKKGLAGISLTDHEALCGHVDFIKEAKALREKEKIPADFKIGLGNEIYLVKSTTDVIRYFHFILIAKNETGHQALKELSSLAWHSAQTVRGMERVPTTYDDLNYIVKKYPNSLIATTACLGGELGYYTLNLITEEKKRTKDEDLIYELKLHIVEFLDYMKSLFGEDFYIEIAPSNSADQIAFNARAITIAKSRGIKVVIGTDAHYLTKDERPIHKAYLTSKNGEREVDEFYSATYIMSDEDLGEYLLFTPELIQECSENSMEIYNKITEYTLMQEQDIPIEEVKQYEKNCSSGILSEYPNISWYLESDSDQDRYWINTVLEKAKEVGYYNERGLSRIEKEADIQRFISDRLGQPLSAYHNTMQHYIDIFWECGSIVGPGRGSACGWLTNMLLGITQVDPLVWDLNEWRYLNKERAEIGDIDIDLAPSKRAAIFKRIREQKSKKYANVKDNSARILQDVGGLLQVCSFGTEGTRSAILTACRGYRSDEFPQGIDVDIAQYMTGMIPQERGFLWPMKDVVEGNEELDRKPITNFINEVQRYPGLLDIILKIEGLVNKRSQHASGVIIYNKEFFKTNALMRSPNGDFTTQFDLHTSEYLGDIKFDFLSTEVSDKIIDTITLLQEAKLIEPLSIREIYNKYLHPNTIPLKDQRIWDALAEGKVLDVFQFNSDVGLQAAKLIQPQNPIEMTSANALMRLMAEKGKERPLSRYVRMKQDPTLWQRELQEYGLGDESYLKILSPYYVPRYATPCMQEDMMLILMDKDISNFTLKEANDARKIVAKKQMKRIPELRDKFFKQCPNELLAHYIWETAVQPQLGYSFSVNHSLPYSFVGIQTLFLATNWPVIFWNCACLINNSGGSDGEMSLQEQEEAIAENCMLEMIEEYTACFPESVECEEEDDDEDDEDEEEEEVVVQKKKKKKTKTTNYGKIATAIGSMMSAGVDIAPPDINKSHMTFYPDLEQGIIRYGMRGINKIGVDVVNMILQNRPYKSIEDFLSKVKVNKPQMINLLKSGAFDSFGQDREAVMRKYIASISDQKKRLTLQNAQMLFSYNLIPEKYDLHKKVFNFNKFLKKNKDGLYYLLDDYAFHFYELHFDIDRLLISTDQETGLITAKILQTAWDAIYQKYMDDIRDYIKANHDQKLTELNNILLKDLWDKYCKGNISKWEMDSISFYYHAHELDVVDDSLYGFTDFYSLPEEPQVDKIINIKGANVPLYKISRIAGTVLDKNKNKSTVTLLTKTGVVQVKVWQNQFSKYDRQLSEKLPSGKKKVVEKSWFARGNKIAVVGIRRGDTFVPKRYNSTPYEGLFNLITSIEDNGELRFRFDREEVYE